MLIIAIYLDATTPETTSQKRKDVCIYLLIFFSLIAAGGAVVISCFAINYQPSQEVNKFTVAINAKYVPRHKNKRILHVAKINPLKV